MITRHGNIEISTVLLLVSMVTIMLSLPLIFCMARMEQGLLWSAHRRDFAHEKVASNKSLWRRASSPMGSVGWSCRSPWLCA